MDERGLLYKDDMWLHLSKHVDYNYNIINDNDNSYYFIIVLTAEMQPCEWTNVYASLLP